MAAGVVLFAVVAAATLGALLWVVRRRVGTRAGRGWKRFATWVLCIAIGPAWFFASSEWMREVTARPKPIRTDPSGSIVADALAVGIGGAVAHGASVIANMTFVGVAGWLVALGIAVFAWRKTPDEVRYSAEWFR